MLALDWLLFKRLRKQGAITLVIASFGAALALRNLLLFFYGGIPRYYSQELQIAIPLLPRSVWGGMRITPDQLFVLGLTAVTVVALHLFLQRSTLGRAMRATSLNPQLARVAGIDPERVLRAAWIIGGMLAAVAGVFAGLTVQLRPTLGLDLLLPLFAAVILGGIGSIWGAVLGGLIVGLAESAAVSVVGAEYRAAAAFAVLIADLLIRPNGLFGEKSLMPDLLSNLGGWLSYGSFFLVFACSFALIALGLNLQWGFTGLFNVGVAGFVAVGAYTSAILTTPDDAQRHGGFGWPVALGWLAAMAASGLCALLIGLVALRLRDDYLAITTFGIAVTIQLVATNAQALTGGTFGVQFIPKPLQAWLGTGLPWTLGYLALTAALLGAAYLALEKLVRSPWGRVLRAIREDEDAAASLGKRAFVFRLQSFVIGSALMGLGGAVYAHFVGYIAPEDFLPILTFQLWAMLIVGGSGNNRGALLGAFVVWGFWTAAGALLRGFIPQAEQARAAALQVVLIGLLIALMLVLRPRGLLGEEVAVSRVR